MARCNASTDERCSSGHSTCRNGMERNCVGYRHDVQPRAHQFKHLKVLKVVDRCILPQSCHRRLTYRAIKSQSRPVMSCISSYNKEFFVPKCPSILIHCISFILMDSSRRPADGHLSTIPDSPWAVYLLHDTTSLTGDKPCSMGPCLFHVSQMALSIQVSSAQSIDS